MITLENISKVFHKGKENELVALADVSLQIAKGEFVTLVGANGSGKTTLLNIIGGVEKPSSGLVRINGEDITRIPEHKRSKWIARVFQNPNNGTAPDLTILDNFRLAALRTRHKSLRVGADKAFKKEAINRIADLGMGLENKLNQSMGNLSGGQRQALTLLMSVMDKTDILLLDEPTAALDPKSARVVLGLADKFNKQLGITVILITHSLKDAQQYGSRLIQLQEGKIARDINTESKWQLSLADISEWFG
ncbi:MAG: ATP-binding cassette domain-containing protein [Chitinophagaceae bacterium]|nr:ATP-binding cassette domain-containing protein [Chitinophagaceae bacterium]